MKITSAFLFFTLLLVSCQKKPAPWNGPRLSQPRNQLTLDQLRGDSLLPFIDMSFFAKPAWASEATLPFSGSISFADTEFSFPRMRAPYPGENTFPAFTVDFIAHDGILIPQQKELIVTSAESVSHWDVIVGTGSVWQESEDGEWNRASFPLTFTDRYIGQARNCVASFVYNEEEVSNVCVQCSQETADLNDQQVGDIRVLLKAEYEPKRYVDSTQLIEQHNQFKSQQLPVYSLSTIDKDSKVADYFEQSIFTNAPTSLGAILMDGKLYLHPPKTRHGLYPYPAEMRHGVYSVTKSLVGALSLLYFAELYGEEIFDALISDYVPALAEHPGWQGVTFAHTLNMVTGVVGSESAEHLLNILIVPRTAEECINNIASLGDAPGEPGIWFNYASTNLFVLSYALQSYVQKKEGQQIYYWDLLHKNVLEPIGAGYLNVMHTIEENGEKGLPILAYGANPTLDEAAKIASLLVNEGNYQGQQLLHKEKIREALGRTNWTGSTIENDFRGKNYRHGFWSMPIKTSKCKIEATYMLGYGGNYILFLPSDVVVFRFLDEYDLNPKKLVRRVERLRSSCE